MKIREFIQATFRGRADKAGALVVYDARKRYHNLVLAMADDHFSVMDATESPSLRPMNARSRAGLPRTPTITTRKAATDFTGWKLASA
jgi:hypothetical protein